VNETILIDAGIINGTMSVDEMRNLKMIFLSHAHLDHLHGVPFMAEHLYGHLSRPLTIAGTAGVLSAVKTHLFNNAIWPDFSAIPNRTHPILRYKTIREGVPVSIANLKVTAISVNHTMSAVGYLVEDAQSAFVYSGDTDETEAIWDYAARKKTLKAAFIEASFPNRLEKLAHLAKHLTPKSAYQEFLKMNKKEIPLYLYHMKVPYLSEIEKEVKALPRNVRMLTDGEQLLF
jgi:ribonuclease BN (tRNA processing enzyme)